MNAYMGGKKLKEEKKYKDTSNKNGQMLYSMIIYYTISENITEKRRVQSVLITCFNVFY